MNEKMQNPYSILGDALVYSVAAGNRGNIYGRQEGLSDRLRQYAYYLTENMVEAGDALLVNDLLDAAKRLDPARAVVTERQFYGAECPSYPNCDGGCGLGCTKKIEKARSSLAKLPEELTLREATDAELRQEVVRRRLVAPPDAGDRG